MSDNTNFQNTTKNEDQNITSGVVPAIQTEYFDIPPHPQVTKEDQSFQANTLEENSNSSANISKANEPTISTTATTQVMGSTKQDTDTKEFTTSEAVKTSAPIKPKGKGKKIIIPTILGLLLLAGGVAAGVLLIRQNQDVRERADTPTCTGCVNASGNCIEIGLTTNTQCGAGGNLCVSCSATQTCVNGSCTTSQVTPPPTVIPIQCLSVEAFEVDEDAGINNSSSWTKLTQNNLAKLATGSYVYFTVTGKDTSGDITKFTKARFKVNDQEFVQVDAATNTKPASTSDSANEIKLFYKYRIPANTKQFEVKASIYHSDQGWIDTIE